MLHMEGLKYVSTPRPSTKRGGGAAIVAPMDKFSLEKLDVIIPFNLEICWGMLRPKSVNNAMIKEIIVVSFYSPPKSNKKSKLIDHIVTTTHILLTKYPAAGLIIGGDKNDLDIAPLIAGIPRAQQIVTSNTINGKILDVIITNMYQLYQVPVVVPPVLPDDPSIGVPSDHSVPIATPLCNTNPSPGIQYQTKVVQPMPQSGIQEFGRWITQEKWEALESNKTGGVSVQLDPSEQAQTLEKLLRKKIDEIFPKMEIRLRPLDKPFITRELKVLDRRKKREYIKKGKSEKYIKLKKKYDYKFKKAAENYLEKNVRSLKEDDPSHSYATLKRMGTIPGDCSDEGSFTLLSHIDQNLTQEQSVEKIAQHFAQISQEYLPLDISSLPLDIRNKMSEPNTSDLPKIASHQVYEKMRKSKKSKSTVPGDLPKPLIQEFKPELAEPMALIFNDILESSQWPSSWKIEHGLPLKKVKVPISEDELRIISLTNYFSKVFEQFVIDWLLKYVSDKLDLCQFGGIKGSSISHYLIELTNFVLYNQDLKNPQAVMALMVDFSKAFNRQNHNILIKILHELGVPGWLLRLVGSFLANRELILKHNGKTSNKKPLPGGTPQGTRLGMFLFLILINFAGYHKSEVLINLGRHITTPLAKRAPIRKKHLKYVDDLSFLASIDLKTNLKLNPNPLRPPTYHDRTGHFLPKEICEISKQLLKLEAFVQKHEMKVNPDKSKVMLFNTSKNWDFTPKVSLGNSNDYLEVVEEIKLLGIVITSDLKWHKNTEYLCQKAYGRLWMVRNLKRLGAVKSELVEVYTKQCRSILELAVPVWSAGLTSEDITSLERVQKTACAIILGREYTEYEDALEKLGLGTLESRRVDLCRKFARKASKNEKYQHWFVESDVPAKERNTRSKHISMKFKPVQFRTDRFRNSPLPYLTSLLN